jgi:hypothetical protein
LEGITKSYKWNEPPPQVDAKWHHNYHSLRCWLASDARGGSAADSLELEQQLAAGIPPASSSAGGSPPQHSSGEQPQQEQQEQQPLPPEVQEAVAWLQRQVELYAKLKLTPLKTQMLRRLGERHRVLCVRGSWGCQRVGVVCRCTSGRSGLQWGA